MREAVPDKMTCKPPTDSPKIEAVNTHQAVIREAGTHLCSADRSTKLRKKRSRKSA